MTEAVLLKAAFTVAMVALLIWFIWAGRFLHPRNWK
jgi:hypothetical protein